MEYDNIENNSWSIDANNDDISIKMIIILKVMIKYY